MLRGKNLTKLYRTFKSAYRKQVGATFDFKSGEKGRVKNIFTYVKMAMDIKDESRFDEVLDMFESYVLNKMLEWRGWNKRSRANLLGFLEKKDEVDVYVAGEMSSETDGLDIAGTQSEDDWDF